MYRFFCSFFLFLSISSCLRQEENLLEGRWKLAKGSVRQIFPSEVFAVDSPGNKYFEFYADGYFTIEAVSSGTENVSVLKGFYNLKKVNDELQLIFYREKDKKHLLQTYTIVSISDSSMAWRSTDDSIIKLDNAEKYKDYL